MDDFSTPRDTDTESYKNKGQGKHSEEEVAATMQPVVATESSAPLREVESGDTAGSGGRVIGEEDHGHHGDGGLGGRGRGGHHRSYSHTHFKVYKRRWFGLVQLVLLNVVVSWDVCVTPFSLFPRPTDRVGGALVAW